MITKLHNGHKKFLNFAKTAGVGYNSPMTVHPWDLISADKRTDKEVQQVRIGICESCEFFTKTRQCRSCWCFMDAKTWLKEAECPKNLW